MKRNNKARKCPLTKRLKNFAHDVPLCNVVVAVIICVYTIKVFLQ